MRPVSPARHSARRREKMAAASRRESGSSSSSGSLSIGPIDTKHSACGKFRNSSPSPSLRHSMTINNPVWSVAEALERQHPFINQTLANHALALLSRLFRCEPMEHHGGFLNLTSGALVALRTEPKVWSRMRRKMRRPEY